MSKTSENYFDLSGRVAVITGGGGLLGRQHAEALASAGAIPVLADIRTDRAEQHAREISATHHVEAVALKSDITRAEDVEKLLADVQSKFGRIDILVNNAANDPKVDSTSEINWSRFENFQLKQWEADVAVGLTGAFLCSQVIGREMAKQGKGVILNIASDLAVIAPDQRLYRKQGLKDEQQPVKPVTYSVVKTGLIGLTRYLATYWAEQGVRVNAISPGGVFQQQPEEFVKKLSQLIPLGRMAQVDEYRAAVLFLCSDASSYMTGQNLVIDGGRSCW